MAKKTGPIKCAKCDLEFPDSVLSEEHKHRAFVFDSKVLCKDCLVAMGGDPNVAQAYATFINTQEKAKRHDW